MSSLDDHIRSVLDRIRVALSGQLEADLTASTADILRAVADEQRQAISDAEERIAGEARLDTEQQVAFARADFDWEREALQEDATAEIEGLERTLGEVRGELDVTRRTLDELQIARDELGRELEEGRRRVEESRSGLESLHAQLERTMRLTSAFRTLNEATSLVDILDRLGNVAWQETGRTVVFLVKGDKLRGWRAFGFDAGESIIGADFDSRASDVLGRRLEWERVSATGMVIRPTCPRSRRLTIRVMLLRCPCRSVDRLLPCCMQMRRGPIDQKNLNGWK